MSIDLEVQDKAVALLSALWRGIPADYKQQYSYDIWDQFQDNLISAAYTTSTLQEFVAQMLLAFGCSIGSSQADRQFFMDLFANPQHFQLRADILRAVRQFAPLLTVLVRAAQDERKQTSRLGV